MVMAGPHRQPGQGPVPSSTYSSHGLITVEAHTGDTPGRFASGDWHGMALPGPTGHLLHKATLSVPEMLLICLMHRNKQSLGQNGETKTYVPNEKNKTNSRKRLN